MVPGARRDTIDRLWSIIIIITSIIIIIIWGVNLFVHISVACDDIKQTVMA